jgi:hypothetical protein
VVILFLQWFGINEDVYFKEGEIVRDSVRKLW